MPLAVTVDAGRDERWNKLVTTLPSSVFHSPPWIRALTETYAIPISARMLVDTQQRPLGGIAFAEITDFLGGRIKSLPFSDFCDPLVADKAQWTDLIGDLIERQRPIDLRCLHADVPLQDDRFLLAHEALWHAVDLERDPDLIWSSLGGSARRSIRKAEAAGVTVRVAEDEKDLRRFYDLHFQIRKYKYKLLAQPFAFFLNLWNAFVEDGNGTLLLAMHDDDVIGGVFFLHWQDTVYYKFNASSLQHLSVRPNDLVLWYGIMQAQQHGLRLLDLGLSEPRQEGLVRYKRKYATAERPVRFLRHDPPGSASSGTQQGRELLQQVTGLLVAPETPDDVSERAGDVLYRYFV